MKTVGCHEMKTHLARFLDDVARGETITITRHGSPMAVLQPVAPAASSDFDALVKQMKRSSRS